MGSEEDSRDAHLFVLDGVEGFDDKMTYVNARRQLGWLRMFVLMALGSFLMLSWSLASWSLGVGAFMCCSISAYYVEHGIKALSLAIETEDERRDEIQHYRELSQQLCLREYRKGDDNERD